MPPFKFGVKVHYSHGRKTKKGGKRKKPAKYLRVSAGPQRGAYVHDLIVEAKRGRKLEGDETVEHQDGNGLNVDPDNLIVVSKSLNTTLRYQRERKARDEEAKSDAAGRAKKYEPWTDQF